MNYKMLFNREKSPHHRKNQDFKMVASNADTTILIVADGHGGSAYVRSAMGSKIACLAARKAIDSGLQGMETMYTTYSEETTEKAKAVCKRFGLLESGGSDFHGANKPHISLGKGEGNLSIPYECFENLRALAKQ